MSHEEALPQIVTYVVVEKGTENKGKLLLSHDGSNEAAADGKRACFGTK